LVARPLLVFRLSCCVLNDKISSEKVRQAFEDDLVDMLDTTIYDFLNKNKLNVAPYSQKYQDFNCEKLKIPSIPIELTLPEDGVFTFIDLVKTQDGSSRIERQKALQKARQERKNKEKDIKLLDNNPLIVANPIVNSSEFNSLDSNVWSLSDPFYLKESKNSNDSKDEKG
jgi:hypothetical protein